MPHQYAPGFASAKKKGVIKPFDERVQICASRLKAAIKKKGGAINVRNEGGSAQLLPGEGAQPQLRTG